ncbi:MAG: ABC transporter ATP-binding protein [Paenibacillus macerans]|uniref:ATP-binding cassette domain-containing protein n=1 Tax=Paenibacillus macerans TaxID=44252 RepID=A0A6N8ENE3_PAEMA|nr:ABC transporter ATP-binding protein [Paenibacillus macerans]MBS5909592.1 ABC transporter ATP-binding protein [Paenibacillus macerans]MDU5949712.1 ABC transporter ATP-binding protein [Paenibacillus macerans]MDU7471819.1 ABC transporter ATP-binding protein [Paenibacillus macerans]MEC0136840.1 ABC transporter ATP-binding protein [Paenibacillus macerans]MEC0329868.1 ABC transporter ATP-binding protein [Paenibacillus macerans]
MVVLEAMYLKKYYGVAPNLIKALDGVNLSVSRGEFVAIEGTSGSGKSTLLNLIGGLDKPTEGKVVINGCELSKLSDDQLTVFRRTNIGFIFQDYNLIPALNVYENVILPVELDHGKIDKDYLTSILEMLDLSDKQTKLMNQLSGGQQQRVAIARALATKPAIILADEPTGNLDSKTSASVMELLRMSNRRFNQTLIMITHNPDIAKLADRIVRIEDGKIMPAVPENKVVEKWRN